MDSCLFLSRSTLNCSFVTLLCYIFSWHLLLLEIISCINSFFAYWVSITFTNAKILSCLLPYVKNLEFCLEYWRFSIFSCWRKNERNEGKKGRKTILVKLNELRNIWGLAWNKNFWKIRMLPRRLENKNRGEITPLYIILDTTAL